MLIHEQWVWLVKHIQSSSRSVSNICTTKLLKHGAKAELTILTGNLLVYFAGKKGVSRRQGSSALKARDYLMSQSLILTT